MIPAGQALLQRLQGDIDNGIGIGRNGKLVTGYFQILAGSGPDLQLINEILLSGAKHPAEAKDQVTVADFSQHPLFSGQFAFPVFVQGIDRIIFE